MKGLNGARVLLLDDKEDEALPLIRALSKAGIATVYFDGSEDDLPKEKQKLRGVRLAILDVNLGLHGAEKNRATTLVQTLSRIIGSDNGPYGVLLWTRHPEDKAQVSQYLFESSALPNPVFVEMLKKSDFTATAKDEPSNKRFLVGKLANAVSKTLSENSPLECMQVWEGSCFEAATRVTNGIGELTASGATQLDDWRRDWREETLKLLFTISRAKAEQHHSVENCIPSMFLALNPLHTDRMDLLVEGVSTPLAKYAEQIMNAQGSSATERKAKVNSMLHLGSDHLDRFEPGNLFVFSKNGKPAFIPTLRDVLSEVIESNPPENAQLVARNALVFALEVTPVCDYAQNKIGLSRLSVGFVLPSILENRIKKKAQFLKRAGPFFLSSRTLSPGAYTLYLNSRYGTSAKPANVKKLKAIARVRPQLLADAQSWLAYQGSRQGVMLLG